MLKGPVFVSTETRIKTGAGSICRLFLCFHRVSFKQSALSVNTDRSCALSVRRGSGFVNGASRLSAGFILGASVL